MALVSVCLACAATVRRLVSHDAFVYDGCPAGVVANLANFSCTIIRSPEFKFHRARTFQKHYKIDTRLMTAALDHNVLVVPRVRLSTWVSKSFGESRRGAAALHPLAIRTGVTTDAATASRPTNI